MVCWQCGVLSQPLLPRSAGLQQVLTEGNVLRLDVSNVRMDVGVISLPQPSLSRSAGLQQVLVEGGVEVGLVTDDNVEESFVGG